MFQAAELSEEREKFRESQLSLEEDFDLDRAALKTALGALMRLQGEIAKCRQNDDLDFLPSNLKPDKV